MWNGGLKMTDSKKHSSATNLRGLPSDDQVGGLLKQFFRQEVPSALNAPAFNESALRDHMAAVQLSVAQDAFEDSRSSVHDHELQSAPAVGRASIRNPAGANTTTRRWAVLGSLAALAASCLLVMNVPQNSDVSSGTAAADQKTSSESAGPNSPGRNSDLMPVSPNAGQSPQTKVVIGADGSTLEEIEGVNLNPKPRK